MVDGHAEPLGDDAAQPAVGVAEDEHGVGFLSAKHRLDPGEDLPCLLAKRLATDAEVVVGTAHAELGEEQVAERGVEVLPGVDETVVAQAVKLLDDAAQTDDFGPRAEDGDDLHRRISPLAGDTSSSISLCRRSTAMRSAPLITPDAELYSPSRAACTVPSLSNSSSIGRIA